MDKWSQKPCPANFNELMRDHKAFRALSTAPRLGVTNYSHPGSAVLHKCSTRVYPQGKADSWTVETIQCRTREVNSSDRLDSTL